MIRVTEREPVTKPNVALSVIICTRHRPRLLRNCLSSVTNALLRVSSSELIVVDNGDRASDEVRQAVAIFGGKYFWESKRGLSVARNRAIIEANGSIIAFLDDDVAVSEDWAQRLIEAFCDGQIIAVTGSIASGSADTEAAAAWYQLYRPVVETRRVFEATSNLPFFPIRAGVCGLGTNMAFRRSFFFRFGFFDPVLGAGTLAPGGEELDRFYVLLKAGGKILFDPEVQVQHSFVGTPTELLIKISGYAAGQAGFLTKWFLSDHDSRKAVLAFVSDRLLAFFLGWRRRSPGTRPIRAPRTPLLLGTLWGPIGYLVQRLCERFWPSRGAIVPGLTNYSSAGPTAKRPSVLMVLYNAGLTGVEKQAALLASNLAGKFRMTVLLPEAGPATKHIRDMGLRVGVVPRWRLRKTLNPLYQLGYLLALPGSIAAYRRAIRTVSADIIHVHSIVNLPPLLAAKLARRPVLLHVHEIPQGITGNLLSRLALLLADRILAVSKAAARNFPPTKREASVFVVYNGVSMENPCTFGAVGATLEQEPQGWITFVGRLSEDKGPHLFLEAVQIVYQQHIRSRFLLCGLTVPNRQRYERHLQELMRKSTIPPSQLSLVRDQEDVEKFIRWSSMLVSSSLVPEAFGLAILEGMALGKPVVAPSQGGFTELIVHEQNGLLYSPGNVRELAQAILRLIRDPDFANQLGAAAGKTARDKFNADRAAEAVLQHYEAMSGSELAKSDLRTYED